MIIRTYRELISFTTFEERFKYLQLSGNVCEETFGFDRFINQNFYKSREWKSIRDIVIVRDNGCDLAMDGHELFSKIIIHHMNPILPQDICTNSEYLINPDYLVATAHSTHNAIHYGNARLLNRTPAERRKNDTCPWRQT